MFKKTTLKNKLRILTAPMSGTNTVTILVLCSTGSDHEMASEEGISHFLEHLFFKGTRRRPTPQRIMRELDAMGSISNAFTTHEFTGYYIKAGHVYLERALDLLADIYTNSLLDAREINRERQVILEEVNRYLDTPERLIWDVYQELFYGDQNAGRSILGPISHIRSFSPEQFRSYFERQYTSQNTMVVMAGNFDETRTIASVTRRFQGIRSGKPRPPMAFKEAQQKPAVKIHYKETDQTHLLLGFRGLNAFHQDRYTADVLATILGGSWSSRMFETVRERMGLAYSVDTSHDVFSNRGMLTTYAGVSHQNAEKAIRAMMGEYVRIASRPVSQRELQRIKDYTKGTTLIALESSNAMAHFVGMEEALTGRPLTVDEVFAKIDAITTEDIGRIARRIIRPDRLNLAIVGPFKNESKFEKVLKL